MKSKLKIITIIIIVIIVITTIIISYKGYFIFNKGFNEFDYLMINILGDAIMVGIVTHISSKYLSIYITKKQFERNNKINITMNKSRNTIINFESFMKTYENKDVFFLAADDDKKIIDYVYSLYNRIINTLYCDGIEKQLLDTILNIPFFIKNFSDENIIESYTDIITKFDSKKRFNNISILKEILTIDTIENLEKFSNIILNIKHYTITNLNNIEGCQILITHNNIVSCKIPCLPNKNYDIYMYYRKEQWINIMAFSYDFDSKEYGTNLSGFKYSNDKGIFKPIHINLKDYINIK